MELNERESHCVARLLQGAMFGNSIDDGCQFCKFRCERVVDMTREIRKRLTDETGVDLSLMTHGTEPLSKFPLGKFLINANADIKKVYREFFEEFNAPCYI